MFKVISEWTIKEVLNAVWYKTFISQYFKKSLGKTGLFPSKEMRRVEIQFFQETIKWSLHLPYKPLESTLSLVDL